MEEFISRVVENLSIRVNGPMSLRFVIQPMIALVFGSLSGLRDARTGKPPYLLSIITTPGHRREMVKDGWKSVSSVFFIAMTLDVIYQLIVQRWVYPFEVVLVAFILAIVPYLILRAVVNFIASRTKFRGARIAASAKETVDPVSPPAEEAKYVTSKV